MKRNVSLMQSSPAACPGAAYRWWSKLYLIASFIICGESTEDEGYKQIQFYTIKGFED
ncbi:MAG: hypothetical protein ABIX36_04990 [Mucilaginibacter sp.]